jgi:hypothetical protein
MSHLTRRLAHQRSNLAFSICRSSAIQALLGLFRHCRAAFFMTNAVMQNYPDQVTEAMRNYADCFVMSQARHETTVHDLEDAPLAFDSSIRSLIENAAHLAVALGRGRLRFTPALSSSPGHAPTHEESLLAEGKSLLWHPLRR